MDIDNQNNFYSDIAIIGGGAAGVFAAINAAERLKGVKITVFEASKKLLSKVIISGGGRCNVTNYTLEPKDLIKNYPRGERELLGPFHTFGVRETLSWFERRNVQLKTESDKRVFPKSDSSSTIANCLLNEARKYGIEFILGEKILRAHKENKLKENETFTLETKNFTHKSKKLILASGGNEKSFQLAESLGHKIISPAPSLFTFNIKDPLIEGLSGVSFKKVKTSLKIEGRKFEHEGPLLITHWGLSGPAVIVLSSHAARELAKVNYKANLKVNFLPELATEEIEQLIFELKIKHAKKQIKSIKPFDIPSSFWERLLELCFREKIPTFHELSKENIRELARKLSSSEFQIDGKGVFKEEFVTAGGVSLKEVNFKTMESKLVKDLYFAGEVLDIDGVTGGFNFQSAWTTAWIASQNI